MEYVIADLEESALVIECPKCDSGYVVAASNQTGEGFNAMEGRSCPSGCGTILIPLNDHPQVMATVVGCFQILLKTALAAPAKVRIRLPNNRNSGAASP